MQVRWDTAKGFHVPELLCKECSSLEETLRVSSVAGAQHDLYGVASHVAEVRAGQDWRRPACALHPAVPLVWHRKGRRSLCRAAPWPQVLSLAVRHRRVGSQEMNMESSRSHSIFTGGPRGGGEEVMCSWCPCRTCSTRW